MIFSGETGAHVRAHFITFLRYRWSDGSSNPLSPRAQRLHACNDGLHHTALRTAPACVSGPYHPASLVRQQDRRAVGGHYGKGKSGRCSGHGIRFRTVTFGKTLRDGDGVGRMHLFYHHHLSIPDRQLESLRIALRGVQEAVGDVKVLRPKDMIGVTQGCG